MAYPKALAEAQGAEPLLTLAAFERLEEKVLREGPQAGDGKKAGEAPVALWQAGAWERRTRGKPWAGKAVRVGLTHGFIDYYGETRADVLPFVPPIAKEVLEVGCARGFTGALL